MSDPIATAAATGHLPKLSIVDLGEHSHARIKKLRKGEGKLMRKVEEAVADLGAGGVVDGNGNVLVVIVREEPWSMFKS